MKKIILISFLILGNLCCYAQTVRVALHGNSYIIKEGKYASLEVDGKIVVEHENFFIDYKTSTGNYFAAENEDGEFIIIDRTGEEVKLGDNYPTFQYKASMINGTIVVQEHKDSKPKYYSENDPSVELQVQKADPDHFEKELEKKGGFSPKLAGQRKDIELIEKALAEVEPIGWFEVRQNSTKGLDLVVDNKVLFNARSFTLISTAEEYKKSNCWFFITTRGDHYQRYAVYGISMYYKDGKKVVENVMTIPYEYTFMSHEGGNVVKCSKNSGSSYFNWWGWNFDRDWRTGEYTPTNKKWVHNESTDKWELQKQEENK
ncbi:hypothetical protein [Bacteroides sp. 519]|uniref:hypothetical protein n=1 Tax=Bacteroides sp. 519 TaxID=2302937 RepID=UPI0013CF8051|nr:hypothetical protein [Bacteroides sp. 519]NDV58882.1 hypothetical protein [Bacteroides sp. 519]